MNIEQKPRQPRDWIFRGFLAGTATGVIIGLIICVVFGLRFTPKGPNVPQAVTICALIGGVVGLTAGIIDYMNKRR